MTKRFFGNIIMLVLWIPYFASSIDTFVDFTFVGNKITQLIWLISIVCSLLLIVNRSKPEIIRNTFILALTLAIYGIVHIMFGHPINTGERLVPTYEYLVGIISSLFPLFFIYYFSYKGFITEDIIRRWSVLFIISVILSYVNSAREIQSISDLEQYTNNIGYVFLRSLPFLFFWYKRPLIQYIIFIIYGLFIINALKRGPILIWAIILIYFTFNNYKNIKNHTFLTRILLYISPLILICLGLDYFNNELVENEALMNRINATMEGDDSGRSAIYTSIWGTFYRESNLFQIIVGHGADATLRYLKIHAHNDWLELLINQGVLGVILYILYYVGLIKQMKLSHDPLGKTLLSNILIIIFITSIFSMSYMAYDTSIHIIMGYGMYRATFFPPHFINER